jgi:hypothetical protein
MPKFKSIVAGLAVSTALTGGVVSLGATTTANASTEDGISTGTSFRTDDGFGWRHRRRHSCGRRHRGWGGGGGWGGGWGGGGWGGWGGGWRRHHRGGGGSVCVKIFNDNTNDNRTTTTG